MSTLMIGPDGAYGLHSDCERWHEGKCIEYPAPAGELVFSSCGVGYYLQFMCRVCGRQCDISPGPGQAVCPECCEDHNYIYIAADRGHFCEHCGQERPYDWGID